VKKSDSPQFFTFFFFLLLLLEQDIIVFPGACAPVASIVTRPVARPGSTWIGNSRAMEDYNQKYKLDSFAIYILILSIALKIDEY
jgi:hypothetical protein